ncbi:hypothetical protein [Desulfonatronospira thiodismutans]|uniref:hypothetical protein n=1 Tax=Desulfonatronospira thiodismutans TaxID=488939 RepID=UPI000197588F|nr:hypothetical protein [Desulfonatronospira thiodismutans]
MQINSLRFRFLKQALPEASRKRIAVLTGARQTGKTTLVRNLYRTRSGRELDLLIETPAGITGVEIKSRDKVYAKDFRTMQDVALKLGNRWRGGLVVYRGREVRKAADPGIWIVPSRRLFG